MRVLACLQAGTQGLVQVQHVSSSLLGGVMSRVRTLAPGGGAMPSGAYLGGLVQSGY